MAARLVGFWDDFSPDRESATVIQMPQRRRPLNWADLAEKDPPDRRWIYPGWLGYDPTILVGMGGVGKTLLAQHLGTALATATPFFERSTEPLTVLMWACEDDKDELWRRQKVICLSMNVPMGSLAGSFVIEPRRGLDNTLFAQTYGQPGWTALYGELQAQINDYHADVLLLDNVGQTFGCNENDRHQVTQFINGIVGLRSGPFCPVMLAHPARGTASEYAGSAAWENAVRMRWLFGETLPESKSDDEQDGPESNVRYLSRRKSNYSAKDWRKFTLVDNALVPDTRVNGDEEMHKSRARRVVLDGFDRLAKMGQDCSAAANAPNNLPKLLLQHRINEGLNRKQLTEALSDLMLDGALKIGTVGQYANRSPKPGLVRNLL